MYNKLSKSKRNKLASKAAIVFALTVSLPLSAADRKEFDLNISGQSAGTALMELAKNTDVQIMIPNDVGQQYQLKPISGKYTLTDALEYMLSGTPLQYEFRDNESIVIKKYLTEDSNKSKYSKDKNGSSEIEEVIVTATKRATKLQDTAMSISVLGQSELEEKSLLSGRDYLSTLPSVSFMDWGTENQIVIRGLGLSIGQQPTSSVYLGDMPLSSALDFNMPDLKLVDIERVEVLRGPQGTLYGSGAMGGTIRQIPVAPKLDAVEGKIKAGYADKARSDDYDYNFVGVVNLPIIEDKLALRVAAYHYNKAGYIDLINNDRIDELSSLLDLPVVVEKDTGGHEYTGVRASALWQVSDDLDVTFMVATQKIKENRRSSIAMSTGEYVFSVLNTGPEFRQHDYRFANLLIEYDLGWADLTFSTSWSDNTKDQSFSHSRLLPYGSHVPINADTNGLVEELRISTKLDGDFQLVGGMYYEDFDQLSESTIFWSSPNLSALPSFWGTDPNNIYHSVTKADISQLAFFGEASYEINDKLTLTAGGRWFDYDRGNSNVVTGFTPSSTGDLRTDEKGTVFKLGADYQPNDSTLLYSIWSEGFRVGTALPPPTSAFGDACDTDNDGVLDGTNFPWRDDITILDSDRTDNLELGGKFSMLDKRITVNAAIYRINWKDIPVPISVVGRDGLGCGTTVNGGEAQSRGLELETVLHATENLQISLSGSYTNTEFTDDLIGKKGERLPFSPEFNGNIGVHYRFSIANYNSFIRADFSHVGNSLSSQSAPNVVFTDSYNKLSMRAGIALDNINLELYGTNLTNDDAVVGVFNLDRGWRLEPRTVGVEISTEF